jgi:hypothetical protein
MKRGYAGGGSCQPFCSHTVQILGELHVAGFDQSADFSVVHTLGKEKAARRRLIANAQRSTSVLICNFFDVARARNLAVVTGDDVLRNCD